MVKKRDKDFLITRKNKSIIFVPGDFKQLVFAISTKHNVSMFAALGKIFRLGYIEYLKRGEKLD